MARRRTKAIAQPAEPFVPTAFLYRAPFVPRDRLHLSDGPLELVHPPRMSNANTEIAIAWLELLVGKLRAMASDDVERCCHEGCDEVARLWQREPELAAYCKPHAPEPHHIMCDEYETRRWK